MAATTTSKRYNVSSKPFDSDDETDEETDIRRGALPKAPRTWSQQIQSWFWSVLWLGGCGFAMLQADLVGVLLYSNALRFWALYLSYIFEAIVFVGGAYMTYTVHPDDFNHVIIEFLPKRPKAIPFITFFWVIGSVLFAIAVWPVYHIMTLPLMFAMFMGFVHALNFLPTKYLMKTPDKKVR